MATYLRALILTALALASIAGIGQSSPQNPPQPFDSAAITRKIAPAVILIKGKSETGEVLGTGFIISSDGKIATNLHVLEHLSKAGVQLASGEKYDSFSILAFDIRKDIAVIKVPGFDLPVVALGNSNSVQVGEPVLAVGSPLGLQGSVTTGVVSSIRDDPFNGGFKVLQTDASVNPGNSGGPLVNRQSEVIGIVTFKIKGGENINFAIPVNYLRGLIDTPPSTMSLEELRLKTSSSPDVFKSDAGPARWKSLMSGTTKIIRRDADRMYVETVLPDPQKKVGCFNTADLQQKGDIYAGIGRSRCVCEYSRGLGAYARTFTNWFTVQYQIEITKLSPTRIEGRTTVPAKGAKFDCRKGTFTKPDTEWEAFVWIPE